MTQVNLVEHFPMISSSVSITDISSGRAFGTGDASSTVSRLNPFSDVASHHWSSGIENKPSWSILDDESRILHIRAHDCPFPATPLHPTCYSCMQDKLNDDVDFVFTWKTTRATDVDGRITPSTPKKKPAAVDHAIQTADTPIYQLFQSPWTDVFGTSKYDLGANSNLLIQHCGACKNPMDPRLSQCASCVQSRAPDGFPDADYIMFVKMVRPKDGLERRQSFPGLHEAKNGQAEPPRFGDELTSQNDPDDTGNTKVFTR
jgi:hypothetical protein